MPLASSSAVQVRYIKESVFGVTPNSGNPNELRVTGETLSFDVTKESSKEINANRGVSSLVPTDASASGALNFEMSYAEYDPLLESVMQSAYVVFGVNGVGATFTGTFTTTTITASVATSGASLFTILKKGQWFRLTAPSHANDGKILRVSTSVDPTSTVITLDANTPAAVGTTVADCAISSSRLTHGTTQTSWTIERNNVDITQFFAYKGMTPSKLSLNIASGSITTGSFDFMGKSSVADTTTALPGSPVASKAYDIHSGVGGATNAVWLDGVPISGTYVKSCALSFDNALRNQGAIGTLGSVSVGSGTINATAQLSVYFADSTLYTKFVNNTNTSLIFSTTDNAGNGYIITMPKVGLASYKTNAGGKDQDMMLDIGVTLLVDSANADASLRKLIFIDRIGAAVS